MAEHKSRLQRGKSGFAIMSVHAKTETREGERQRIVSAVLQREACMTQRRRAILLPQAGAQKAIVMAHRDEPVSERISRVEIQRTSQQRQSGRGSIGHAGVNIRLGVKNELVGIETVRALAPDPLDLGSAQARLDGAHYRERDLVL